MNWDLISIIVFYTVIFLLFLKYKKKFTMQGILALYKTKLGLKLMDKLANMNPTFLKLWSATGIVTGFLGMVVGLGFIVKETLKFLIVPGTQAPLVPVFPGIAVPGVPTLGFWHWIIAILIAATIHEFSHGVIARFYKIPIKSSGFAFLGPILAAFVEPDEKIMAKKKPWKQIGVFAAGPFSNIVVGIMFFFLFTLVTVPLYAGSIAPAGIITTQVLPDTPAEIAGLVTPFTILELNGKKTLGATDFVIATQDILPDQEVELVTDCGTYILTTAEHPENNSKGYMGVGGFEQKLMPAGKAEGKPWLLEAFGWLNLLVMWLFIINVGIAIFNLLPFMPADGGRMSLLALTTILPKNGKKVWMFLNIATIALIVINLLPWVFKLLVWTFRMFAVVISFGLGL